MSHHDIERRVGLPTETDAAAKFVSSWKYGAIILYRKGKVKERQTASAY
ncbi:hypothetical protein [Desulfobacca acetoxidans]|nr:hypothetical protein [Desulfobacca acetoxidans]